VSKRQLFHLVFERERWLLKRDKRVLGSYHLKTDAASIARRIAASHAPSELLIHRRDGAITDRSTYGSDPKRSKG
jgi:hypothetical protein